MTKYGDPCCEPGGREYIGVVFYADRRVLGIITGKQKIKFFDCQINGIAIRTILPG